MAFSHVSAIFLTANVVSHKPLYMIFDQFCDDEMYPKDQYRLFKITLSKSFHTFYIATLKSTGDYSFPWLNLLLSGETEVFAPYSHCKHTV